MKTFINKTHTQLVIMAETDEDYELLRNLKNVELWLASKQTPGEAQVVKAATLMNNIKVIEETPLSQT